MVADELRRQADVFLELQDLSGEIARAHGDRPPRPSQAASAIRDNAPPPPSKAEHEDADDDDYDDDEYEYEDDDEDEGEPEVTPRGSNF